MNTTSAPSSERLIRGGLTFLAVLVVGLSARCLWDVCRAERFPAWFAPAFSVAVVVGTFLVLLYALQKDEITSTVSRRVQVSTWALLALSFVCTTSLHSFFPFRPSVPDFWENYPGLRLNIVLAGAGFAIVLVLASLHALRSPRLANATLVLLAPLLLIPNDDCRNEFNIWWIDSIGASPLMYIPNVLAVMIASAILRGRDSRLGLWLLTGVCVAVFLLGMSHRLRIVW